jgi:hypothetical protein
VTLLDSRAVNAAGYRRLATKSPRDGRP